MKSGYSVGNINNEVLTPAWEFSAWFNPRIRITLDQPYPLSELLTAVIYNSNLFMSHWIGGAVVRLLDADDNELSSATTVPTFPAGNASDSTDPNNHNPQTIRIDYKDLSAVAGLSLTASDSTTAIVNAGSPATVVVDAHI